MRKRAVRVPLANFNRTGFFFLVDELRIPDHVVEQQPPPDLALLLSYSSRIAVIHSLL